MNEEIGTSAGDSATLPLVLGIDLGGTQIRTAVLQGKTLISRVGMLTGDDSTPDHIMPRMFQAVQQALKEADVPLKQIAGIGIGAPGPLNSRTGIVFAPPNLHGWTNVPLREMFQTRFELPTFVENDANAAALGEHMFGAGRGCKEMVYVTISTGVGGGVIAGGKLLEGTVGTAAELGHMTIDLRGERCNCGNIGCLESISSGTAIARRANEMVALGKAGELLNFALTHQENISTLQPDAPLHINARTVAQAAEAGIPQACDIIASAAEGLGVGLINIIHIFNPELIILGGSVAQIGDRLLAPARRLIAERALRVPRDAAEIILADLGADVGLVGAGALVYYHRQSA